MNLTMTRATIEEESIGWPLTAFENDGIDPTKVREDSLTTKMRNEVDVHLLCGYQHR